MTGNTITRTLALLSLVAMGACDMDGDSLTSELRSSDREHVFFVDSPRHGPQILGEDGQLTSWVDVDGEWSWSADHIVPLDASGERLPNPTDYSGALDFEPIDGATLTCLCADSNGGWTQGGCSTPCTECCPDNGGANMDSVVICGPSENGQSPNQVPPCN